MARRAPPPEIKAIVRSDDRRHPRPATLRRGGQTAGARLKRPRSRRASSSWKTAALIDSGQPKLMTAVASARSLPRVPSRRDFKEDPAVTQKLWRSRWKHGWIFVGVVLIAGVVIFGASDSWSPDALLVIGIVVAAYLAFPPMIASLNDLARRNLGSGPAASTGTGLTWDPALNDVVRELAVAFDTIEDAHDIGASSGLRMERVRASRTPVFYWQQILSRALDEDQQRVDCVLDEALARSERAPLRAAIGRYREQRGRGLPKERPTSA
jgi:hypothetical protein